MIKIDLTKANEDAAKKAMQELAKIDVNSIRSMREYIANQADAPQTLKDKELLAQAARGKLK